MCAQCLLVQSPSRTIKAVSKVQSSISPQPVMVTLKRHVTDQNALGCHRISRGAARLRSASNRELSTEAPMFLAATRQS